ncbi:MAG: hypothetical protein AMS18_00140 [Gemmatimonas sp. SG8_17]|nr:MAG: hypothetical protein AMS18_00140 [Gemmatimonas sp. SG8_17]
MVGLLRYTRDTILPAFAGLVILLAIAFFTPEQSQDCPTSGWVFGYVAEDDTVPTVVGINKWSVWRDKELIILEPLLKLKLDLSEYETHITVQLSRYVQICDEHGKCFEPYWRPLDPLVLHASPLRCEYEREGDSGAKVFFRAYRDVKDGVTHKTGAWRRPSNNTN